jgi:hypothetical protein
MIDDLWIRAAVAQTRAARAATGPSVERLRGLLSAWATGFARARADVISGAITWPRRGIEPDESSAFLAAVDAGHVLVDEAGYFSVQCARAKSPAGRYALFSRSGDGVAINLEYIIQAGTAAELVSHHGWAPSEIEFERGEFDALGRLAGRTVLAVEAKCRVTGSDSLESLLRAWLNFASTGVPADNNAGRKYRELASLCVAGPVAVWLVADGARWAFVATVLDGRLDLTPLAGIDHDAVLQSTVGPRSE